MNMKEHILAALQEQLRNWEEMLANLSEDQITAPKFDLDWSIKDVITHLWAWQQISSARMEGALHARQPQLPKWIVESVDNWEDEADRVNAITFDLHHEKPWSEIYYKWRTGLIKLVELGAAVPERTLLDDYRYPWLNGYSLASVLIASYDHHQEHLDKLQSWLHSSENQ